MASFHHLSIYWSGFGCWKQVPNSLETWSKLVHQLQCYPISSLISVSMIMHDIKIFFAKFGSATYSYCWCRKSCSSWSNYMHCQFIRDGYSAYRLVGWIFPIKKSTHSLGSYSWIASMVKSVTFTVLIWSDMVDVYVPNTFSNKDKSGWGTVTSLFLWVLIISSLTLTENICPIWVGARSLGTRMWLSHPFRKNVCQI